MWKGRHLDSWKCASPYLLHFIYCACTGEALECKLPGQLLIYCACTGEALECKLPGQLLIYCACTGEALECKLPGQLEVCLSLTSYISYWACAG